MSFGELTERPGTPVSKEGAAMISARYGMGAELAENHSVLELAAGSGLGLGLLRERARFLVGADIDTALLEEAQDYYEGEIPLVCLTAEALPFEDECYDLVLFFEATYYVPDLEQALDEVTRVLRLGGRLMIASANPERPDFIPSPHSHYYYTAQDFRLALERRGFDVELRGAFPVSERGVLSRAVVLLRRIMTRLGLIPKSLKGRALLKRLVHGRLSRLPSELTASSISSVKSEPLRSGSRIGDFKVFYVIASK